MTLHGPLRSECTVSTRTIFHSIFPPESQSDSVNSVLSDYWTQSPYYLGWGGGTCVNGTTPLTCGHKYKLYKLHCQCNTRRFFFTERVVNVWNSLESLPQSVNFSSLATFKRTIREVDFSEFLAVSFSFATHILYSYGIFRFTLELSLLQQLSLC